MITEGRFQVATSVLFLKSTFGLPPVFIPCRLLIGLGPIKRQRFSAAFQGSGLKYMMQYIQDCSER